MPAAAAPPPRPTFGSTGHRNPPAFPPREEHLAEEKAERGRVPDFIREQAAGLPPESADGIVIAVALPSHGRIQRKFLAEEPGADVLAFVADHESMFDGNGDPLAFELSPGLADLVREKTLAEQGITRRTLLG
jgi:hypothetical protein